MADDLTPNDDLLDDAGEALENAGDAIENTGESIEQKGKEVLENVEDGVNDLVENVSDVITADNKKVLAGVLAIVLGGFGVHKFILGYTTEGIIQIVITFVTCGAGSLVGLIEGIIYLTKTDDEFYQTYQVNKKGWF